MTTPEHKIHILVIEVPMDDEPGDKKYVELHDDYEGWLEQQELLSDEFKTESQSDVGLSKHFYEFTGQTPQAKAERIATQCAKRIALPVKILAKALTREEFEQLG